ncbi:MAG: penicillin-binding transpeptidase domain-containing protein, partial [Trueperaceae bacterium]|nr:penicillin-binding transpeptidase domain-containing protein [Trueperaceae bacterium]
PASEVVPGERKPDVEAPAEMTARLRLVLAFMLTLLVVFTGRLMYLQLARAEAYQALSEQNFTQERRIAPLRGRVLARDGTVLADNRVAYDLMYWGGEVEGWDRLAAFLGLEGPLREPDRGRLEEALNGAVVVWNIPDHLVPAIEERIAGQPSLYLRERIERTYPTNLAAQVVGYTSQADPVRNPGYGVDDLAGVMGIEATWEVDLYGAPGMRRVQVDHRGAPLRSEVVVPATPGTDVVLTIDPLVQRMAEDVLAGALRYVNVDRARVGLPLEEVVHGALIALDPRTGEILAMASTPTFDQTVFAHRPIDPTAVGAYLNDAAHKPLQNRAVEAYVPASTFKVVTAKTLLDGGWIGEYQRFSCPSRFTLGGIVFQNWAPYDKGQYDVRDALADSCNTFFWNAAVTTPDATRGWGPFIADEVATARDLGFGAPVGVGLQEERAGRIPDETWVRATYEHGWFPGFTMNTIIGQGDVLATPVQVAQLIQTVAMDGLQVQPHLVRQVGDEPLAVATRQVAGAHWDVLQEGMRMMFTDYPSRAVLGPGAFPVAVAGKTGTGQTSRGGDYTHAWFMGYGPIDDPEIAIVAFIEYGGSSSQVAVPLARDFFAAYWGVGEVLASTPTPARTAP